MIWGSVCALLYSSVSLPFLLNQKILRGSILRVIFFSPLNISTSDHFVSGEKKVKHLCLLEKNTREALNVYGSSCVYKGSAGFLSSDRATGKTNLFKKEE
jgi:hypothetical protein